MRLIMRFSIPVQKGNAAASDGTLARALKSLVDKVSPEAAYFHLDDGARAGTLVFDADDQLNLAEINEPLFSQLDANIDVQPAISLDELLERI